MAALAWRTGSLDSSELTSDHGIRRKAQQQSSSETSTVPVAVDVFIMLMVAGGR